MSIWLATLDSRSFSFEAYGTTASESQLILIAGLERHALTYAIPRDWFADMEIETREIRIGLAYRDRESI